MLKSLEKFCRAEYTIIRGHISGMLSGDYHTHTTYSSMNHGKGSVDDNVRAALALGLKEIALTDHGLRHMTYGMTKKAFPRFLADVAAAREKYPDINVYAGLEANFISPNGVIDVDPDVTDKLDVLVCGYHKIVRPKFGGTAFLLRNLVTKNSRKALVKNTDAYLRAIENYEIDILSHPNTSCRIDLKEVGGLAAKYGTYIELNGKRVSMTADDLIMLASLGCKFVMDSDAHSPDRVGDVSYPLEIWKTSGLPMSLIHNWDRLPDFRSGKVKR